MNDHVKLEIKHKIPEILHQAKAELPEGQMIFLRDFWKEKPALLIYLRHFGCIGCSQHVNELIPRIHELKLLDINIVFIGNGNRLFIDHFLEKHGLKDKGVHVVTDTSLESFKAAGLFRTWWGTLGPGSIINVLSAFGKGFTQTSIEGDLAQQGGILLIDSHSILRYYYQSKRIGDFPNTSLVMAAAYRLFKGKAPVSSL